MTPGSDGGDRPAEEGYHMAGLSVDLNGLAHVPDAMRLQPTALDRARKVVVDAKSALGSSERSSDEPHQQSLGRRPHQDEQGAQLEAVHGSLRKYRDADM